LSNITDGGTPVFLTASVRTLTDLVLTWSLPFLGAQPDITYDRTEVTYTRVGSGVVNTSAVQAITRRSTFGITLSDLDSGAVYMITIRGIYSTPMLSSGVSTTMVMTRPIDEGKCLYTDKSFSH